MTLKVATYNIHSCIDTARVVDMEKIAGVIAETGAEVAALQEVDADKPRTGGVDQAKWLADRLGMDRLFYPVVTPGEEKYGLAVLSAIPMEKIKFGRLPAPAAKKPREIRGVMWIRLQTRQGPVNLLNTHLGLRTGERRLQIEELMGDKWIGALDEKEPIVFCGDLNAGRRSYVYRRVCKRFFDVQRLRGGPASPRPTFLSFYPIWCLDYIFVSAHFSVVRAAVPFTRLARRASDHLPVFAEVSLTAGKMGAL